jgi:hypothetical protein
MNQNAKTEKISSDRRAFIKTATLCGGAAILTGIPLATYFIAPAMKKGTGKWLDFGAVEDLKPGSFEMLSYEFMVKDGWLVLVIWQEGAKIFECPCHSGRFDADGQPIAGPPTKPLIVLEHKIEDDNLMVYLTV